MSAWRHVKIVVSGSNIKVYVDGNLEIDYNDATYTSGYFGFNVFGVKAHFDNLVIKDNTETYYIRGAGGEVLAEYDLGGNLVAEYVYANGQRIVKRNPAGNVDIYLNDHLGSARAMVGNGWSANYYPFGEVASQTGSDEDTHFDFTGQERDHGTGLIYFPRRYYDPEIGRWLSVDPLSEKYPSLSPYNYVANNPLKFFDPDGSEIKNSLKMVLNNKTLISSLRKFDLAVAKRSGLKSSEFTFIITGGDRYKKDGKIYSATSGKEIKKSSKISRHLQERGALGADLSYAEGVSKDIIKKAAKDAGFDEIITTYDDGHFHLSLPLSELKAYLNDKNVDKKYIPSDSDFQSLQQQEKQSGQEGPPNLLRLILSFLRNPVGPDYSINEEENH